MSKFILKNYMEDCVEGLLQTVIKGMDICKCEKCQMDIMAYTLNQLQPKYIATLKGHMFAKADALSNQFDADVITALSKGAKLVGDNPRHE